MDEYYAWLRERGYSNPYASSTHRCKVHGYRNSGVFHYPTVEDRHTYYSCTHCLREIFESAPDSIPTETPIRSREFTPCFITPNPHHTDVK